MALNRGQLLALYFFVSTRSDFRMQLEGKYVDPVKPGDPHEYYPPTNKTMGEQELTNRFQSLVRGSQPGRYSRRIRDGIA